VQGTSGNLDPIVALIDGTGDTKALQETHTTAIQRALVEGSACVFRRCRPSIPAMSSTPVIEAALA